MRISDQEQLITAAKLTSPRVTPADIEAIIVKANYHVFSGTCLTVCCLTLRNGFTVLGESACASPENFRAELGEQFALENAKAKLWQLEGYLLKQRLYEQSLVAPTTHLQRLRTESDELGTKITKLEDFVNDNPIFETLDEIPKLAMKAQLEVMRDYASILTGRIRYETPNITSNLTNTSTAND